MPVRLRQIETPEPLAIDYRPVASLIPFARNARTHSESPGGADRRLDPRIRLHQPGAGRRRERHHRRPRQGARGEKARLASVPVIELGTPQRQPEARLRPRRQPAGRGRRLGHGDARTRGRRPLGSRASTSPASASRLPRSTNRCPPPPPGTRARRRRPSPLPSRSRAPATSGCSAATGCSAAAPPSPADVGPPARGVRPHLMATDPPYGVAYDPAWRNRAGASTTRRTGKVLNDDRADWRAAWALFPGEVACVWHGPLHATTVADSLDCLRLRDPQPDHLGQGAAGAQPRRLPLATRAVLVRRPRQRQGALERRSETVDALVDPEPRPGRGDGARHPEAGRGDAPADAEQQRPGPAGLRAVLRIGHLDHRRRDLRPDQPLDGARSGLRRRGGHRRQAFTGESATLDGDDRSFAEVALVRDDP